MATLVMIRHGQSTWNLQNRFTGWVDITLSPKGIEEAIEAGKHIADIDFTIGYTSTLLRAQTTLALACAQSKRNKAPILQFEESAREKAWSNFQGEENFFPVIKAWQLNERFYGDLQGLNKAETAEKFGAEQVHIWRRSYSTPPPNGESLEQTVERTWPYFESTILPHLVKGENVLIVAHGNSIRAIVKMIEEISDEEIPAREIATGDPLVYEYEDGAFTRR